MQPISLASRAILARYATKVIRPIEYVVIGIFLALVVGTILLVTYVSAWWWLLMIIVVAYGVIGSVVWLIIHFTIDRLRPDQTPAQKQAVEKFITRAERVADTLQLTRFGLILRVIQSVMTPKRANIISEFTTDSKELKGDLERVVEAFK